MAALKHFIYSKETTFGTWVTPAKAVWVTTATATGGRETVEKKVTGSNRSPLLNVLGAKALTHTVELPWWFNNIGTIFSTFLRTSAITAVATGVKDHAMLYLDTSSFLPLSIQEQHNATLGFNYLSCAVNSWEIKTATKEEADLSFDLIPKDEAIAGGVWDYDGVTASPALVSSPSYPTLARPLMFYDASIIIGGTPALDGTSKKLSLSGGTAYTKLRNVSIKGNHNLDADAFGLAAPDPTIQEINPGDRAIELSFDVSWSDYSTTLYAAARAGTALAFELDLVGPIFNTTYKYEAHVIIPSVHFNPVDLPPIDGDHANKILTVTGIAQQDTVTGVDFGLWIRTDEATL